MADQANRLAELWQRSQLVLRAPRVRIEVSGDEEARELFRSYTAPHPRFRITPAKRWGVALLRVPYSFDAYLADRDVARVRRQRRRAEKAGYRHVMLDPAGHLDEILAINRSAPVRQGRAMAVQYVDPERLAERFGRYTSMHGMLDGDGRLRAYAVVPDLGDVHTFRMVIGHADCLDDGVMYFLVSEVVRACVEAQQQSGKPTWLMYDTLWGASRGLAFFKQRFGFAPYTVDWVWVGGA